MSYSQNRLIHAPYRSTNRNSAWNGNNSTRRTQTRARFLNSLHSNTQRSTHTYMIYRVRNSERSQEQAHSSSPKLQNLKSTTHCSCFPPKLSSEFSSTLTTPRIAHLSAPETPTTLPGPSPPPHPPKRVLLSVKAPYKELVAPS